MNNRLSFAHLPPYARFILNSEFEDFVKDMLTISREEDIPLLRLLNSLSDAQLIELGKKTTGDLLRDLASNQADEYISRSVSEWIANTLPVLDRDQIVADDLTLFSLVRRKAFRNYLPRYTSDITEFGHVMEEVDRFTSAHEAASFDAFVRIQQEKLRKLNDQLLEAESLANMGSFLWDMKNDQASFSPGVMHIFEIAESTSLNSFLQFVHQDDRYKVTDAIAEAMKNGGVFDCEYRYQKNTHCKTIWSRGLVNFHKGAPASMKGTVVDITEKHEARRKIEESEELLKQAQKLTHIGNWSWEITTGKILWSDEMYRIYGLEPQSETITFERFMSLVHPDDREKRMSEIEQTLQTGIASDYILKIVNPDGKEKILKGKGELVTGPDKNPFRFNGTCQDITHEYQLTAELHEKEDNLQQLIRNAPDGVIVINEESIITLWNPQMETLFGWEAAEVIGQPLTDTIIPDRYQQGHLHGMNRLLTTGIPSILNKPLELPARDKIGREFFISLTVSRTLQDGRPAFIAFIRDMTLEKETRRELLAKTAELEQKNKDLRTANTELESFNYAASHDLQEPLRKIRMFSSRIIERDKEAMSAKSLEDFSRLQTSSSRMQMLISDLLTYSQHTLKSDTYLPIDLNIMLDDVEEILQERIAEKKAVIERQTLPSINGIPFQIRQVFINILDNALKYHEKDNTPLIKISWEVKNAVNSKGPPVMQKYLQISISDNGIGFSTQYNQIIFDLFARLHNRTEFTGTGIGLAICKKIITNHGGFIAATSEPGKGSVFQISLPAELIIEK